MLTLEGDSLFPRESLGCSRFETLFACDSGTSRGRGVILGFGGKGLVVGLGGSDDGVTVTVTWGADTEVLVDPEVAIGTGADVAVALSGISPSSISRADGGARPVIVSLSCLASRCQ